MHNAALETFFIHQSDLTNDQPDGAREGRPETYF